MADEVLLAEQLEYYRRRAGEYDVTAYGDVEAAEQVIDRIVDDLRPGGEVLELACGTGLWTRALVRRAGTVTAVDAAPEMLAVARARVPGRGVEFALADVFSWQPPHRYDLVFFAFWLSHVPPARFGDFWAGLRSWLVPGGRVVFVDEDSGEAGKEVYAGPGGHVVLRRLRDGSTHRVVKVFVGPDEIADRLSRAGWRSAIRQVGQGWIVGEAWPARTRTGAPRRRPRAARHQAI